MEVVDFSYAFWDETMGILSGTVKISAFYLLKPLHLSVWMCYVAMAAFVSILLYCGIFPRRLAMLSHYLTRLFGGLFNQGKYNHHQCA